MTRIVKSVSAFRAILLTFLAVVSGASAVSAASPEERDAWNAARMLNSRAAYQSFLESYPNSEFADRALSSMVESVDRSIEDSGASSASTGESY